MTPTGQHLAALCAHARQEQEWIPIMTDQYPDGTVDAKAGFGMLTLIRETQLAHTAELKVIKGQLTDLPGMNRLLAATRLDLRSDIESLRDQAAELPSIRAQLEEQARELAKIEDLLVRLVETTRPPEVEGNERRP
jgi:predicted nuclease with TOPRIM domain